MGFAALSVCARCELYDCACSTNDQLVDLVAAGIAKLRESHCGGVALTDEQVLDRARNVVAAVVGNYHVTPRAS